MQRRSPFIKPLNTLIRAFLPPSFLFQPAAALDISETSIKYMDARFEAAGYVPQHLQKFTLPEGVVRDGFLHDEDALLEALEHIKTQSNRRFISLALPEDLAYLFTFTTTHAEHIEDQVSFAISENVPLDQQKVVYDYALVPYIDQYLVAVVAYEAGVIEGYLQAATLAGFSIKRIEPEVFAIARSVVPHEDVERVSMIVDIGAHRTVVAVTRGNLPVFATTIAMGMEPVTELISEAYKVDLAETYRIQNYLGLQTEKKALARKMKKTLRPLIDEIARQFSFWDSRRDKQGHRIHRIEQVYLSGGGAALRGFREELASVLRVPVQYANVWQHLFDMNAYLPDISRSASLQYAALAGLLLLDVIEE